MGRNNKYRSMLINQLTPAVLLGLAGLITFFTISGDHGLLHLFKINNEVQALEGENRELREEIVDVSTKVAEIQQSNFALEKYAREVIGLSRPNEIIYINPEQQQSE